MVATYFSFEVAKNHLRKSGWQGRDFNLPVVSWGMTNNYFLVGLPKSGKTTILRQLAKDLQKQGYRVGGFLSPEMMEHGTRKGFDIEDIATGKTARLADEGGGGPRIGRYHVDVRNFESIAMQIMENAYQFDVIFIDEIGAMELESIRFADALADLMQTDTPVVASLGQQYISTYEIYGTVYGVSGSNRNQLYRELLEMLLRTLRKKPAARLKFDEKEKVESKTRKAFPRRMKTRTGRKPLTEKAMPKKSKKGERLVRAKRKGKARKPAPVEKRPRRKEGSLVGQLKRWLGG